jgi:hypothetical protein
MKLMLDTNCYDQVIKIPGFLINMNSLTQAGKIEILSTHVQEDELNRIPDLKKRAAVLSIPRKLISTSGAIYDISKYGQARYGSGKIYNVDLGTVKRGNPNNAEDALIALTAAHEVDVFVTEDVRLRKR